MQAIQKCSYADIPQYIRTPPLPLGGEKGWKRGVGGGAADAENRDKKAK